MKKALSLLLLLNFAASSVFAGLEIRRSNGITLTGADGINFIDTSGITLTGADGFLPFDSNGITLTGADGITLTGADGITLTGADGSTYTGPNGITLTGADGITLTGADGITLTGADGITLTGADGTQYTANSILMRRPDGITLTGADGITLTGADGITLTGADGAMRSGPNGITLTGADGITLTGADGITLTGADGITLTGADQVTGLSTNGIVFDRLNAAGMTLTGADGITLTGADGITLTGADGISMKNVEGVIPDDPNDGIGLQSVDPELAIALDRAADDSNINAVIVYHDQVTDADITQLQQMGINGGTRFRVLPCVYVTATKRKLIDISRLSRVRSIYGNRTLSFNADPYFAKTGITRVAPDNDLKYRNGGFPVSGRNVTVAVLDTGINGLHPDLAGKVVQNVKLADVQSAPLAFLEPAAVENLSNSDPVAGHGTFVAGIIAGTGASSGGRFNGVAPGAKLLGLSVGDVTLTSVLSGLDYLLDRGPAYNVKVVNCSFSANTVYDVNDPVNIATKMLTGRGVSVVFSAGNAGPKNASLNPYAAAPWVVSVGATDENGVLAGFSSRGTFGGFGAPTVVAPGVNVASVRSTASTTGVGGVLGADPSRLTLGELPFYTTASGTSFSAPQAAGAIALMLEANPNLQPAQIKELLAGTATPLPKYFAHETGAGMLNTYAAVLEAAFPERPIGIYRSTLSRNAVRFTTSRSQAFTELVTPGTIKNVNVPVPADTVLATLGISWGLSTNDFGLKLYTANDSLAAQSNYLNLPGLTGRHEQVAARQPAPQTFRAAVQHTAGVGTAQNVYGVVELTRVEYPDLIDINGLTPELRAEVQQSLLNSLMLPEGKRFGPNVPVRRSELASALLRSGAVPQYMAATPLFTDVKDVATRNAVESVQTNPAGKLFYDAAAGGQFNPNGFATKLVTAVAMVKAAGLDGQAAASTLPANVVDGLTIPAQWRGYVAVALQRGFVSLDGSQFSPNRPITRLELTRAVLTLMQ